MLFFRLANSPVVVPVCSTPSMRATELASRIYGEAGPILPATCRLGAEVIVEGSQKSRERGQWIGAGWPGIRVSHGRDGVTVIARSATLSILPGSPLLFRLSRDAGSRATSAEQTLFEIALTYAAAEVGGVMLHAGAFAIAGRVPLVVGRSGSGKSTLCKTAVAAGGRVVSDDALLVSEEPGYTSRLWPLRSPMIMREPPQPRSDDQKGTAHRRHLSQARRTVIERGERPEAFIEAASPTSLWFMSIDNRRSRDRVERISMGAALGMLIGASNPLFFSMCLRRSRDAQIPVLRRLAENCPAYRISLSSRLLHEPRETLSELLEFTG